ncbi:hypothetical protein KR018_006570, partial [Drosophila ironensis]
MDNIYYQTQSRYGLVEEVDEMSELFDGIYIRAAIMSVITIVLWITFRVMDLRLANYLPFSTYVPLILVFLILVVLHCCPITMCSHCDWILIGLALVFTIIGGAGCVDGMSVIVLILAIICTAAVVLLLNFMGAICPSEILPGGVCSTTCMIFLMVALIIVGITQLITGSETLLCAFMSILMVMLVIAIPIQAQFHSGRLENAEVVPSDHLPVCAVTVYLHSIMFFGCLCYFV